MNYLGAPFLLYLWILPKSTGLQLADGSFLYCVDDEVNVFCTSTIYNRLRITSATYGNEIYKCGAFGPSCFEENTTHILGPICDGIPRCIFNVTDDVFGSSCGSDNSRLHFTASCYATPTTEVANTISSITTSESTDETTSLTTDETTSLTTDETTSLTTDETTSLTTEQTTSLATEETTHLATEETTSLTTSSTSSSSASGCLCSCQDTAANVSLEAKIQQIIAVLTIDKDKLSSKIRKKTSAEDSRKSSAYMGYSAIIFISVTLGMLLLADVSNIFIKV